MALDYKKFVNLIPKNTLDFLYITLPELKHYVSKNLVLKIGDYSVTNNDIKIVIIFLNGLRKITEYNNIFGILKIREISYKNKEIENKAKSDELKQFYDDNTYLFDLFDDEIDYASLTPLKLLSYQIDKLSTYEKEKICDLFNVKKDVFDKLKKLVLDEESVISEDIKNKNCEKLPINLISYLECASKIRAELIKNRANLNNNYITSIDDINSVSLFLSLYFYDDIKSDDKFFISERDIIKKILKASGIDLDGIKRAANINITSSSISNHKSNYFVLDKIYSKYYDEKNRPFRNYICDIVRKSLRREDSNSIALEKIFLHLNCYLDMIDLSSEAVYQAIEEEKVRMINEYTKAFYSDLSMQVREFINFTAKAYIYILNKMRHYCINKKFVSTEDDADTLALYIASHYFDGDVDLFFTNQGVSFEKVLKLLELKITKKDIEDTPLDVTALVERFKRYVYEGVNSHNNSKNLTIKDIVHNLCNKKFNCSSIMNDIFNSLSKNEKPLDDDFLSQLNKYFEEREKAIKEKLKVKFFRDLPLDTVNYLENVSSIYNTLSKSVNFEEKDLVCFSLLIGAFIKDRSEICKVLNSIGFDYKKILSFLNLSSSKNWGDPNIEILNKHFGEYVFGGFNKGCERKNITVKQIVKNILNKELNNSLYMSKLLNTLDLSYSNFEEFDKLYDKALTEIEYEEKKKSIEKQISDAAYDTSSFIEYVLRIFRELKNGPSSNMINPDLVNGDNDLIELSLVLATLAYDNNASKFFAKYDITIERVCEYLRIESYALLDIAKNASYNVFDLTDYFNEYMLNNKKGVNSIDSIINNIFDERLNNSLVLENICNNFGISYPILKREVLSKKDYEESLSIKERTELLLNKKVDEIKFNDRKSMLRYGNDLGSHSKYIFNELPRLQLNDTNDTSIIEITSSLNNLYTSTEPKKKGFFAGLFQKKAIPSVRIISEDNLRILKSNIEEKIQLLDQELQGYEAIREYMEAFRKKNKEYLVCSNEILKSLEEKSCGQLDIDNELIEKLKNNEDICFMRAKVERFSFSDQLYVQKLIEISQSIIAHRLTINSLEMARDLFVPLVWSYLAIEKGASTSNSSLEITDTVIDLFESLLIKNSESIVKNMNKLKSIQIDSDKLLRINDRVNSYINSLNEANAINTSTLSLGNLGNIPEEQKKLTLTGN